LWSFNDERVVRAIAASPIPVVCGVGHETDLTLADLAADLRAPTPTAAAELVAPPTAQCGDALNALLRRARRLLEHRLDQQAQRLDGIALRLARPAEAVRQRRQHLALLQQRLASSVAREAERRTTRLAQLHDRLKRAASVARRGEQVRVAALADRLRALDPQQVLERGYAWLSDDSGRLLQSVRQLQPQTLLRATLADGQAELEVLRVQPDGSPPA
jgi:exodeoxyribonuclease VII large subunit